MATQYKVLVDDNFHHMDEDARTEAGTYATAEEALAAVRARVDANLKHLYQPGMTAETLYSAYTDFGEDPFIVVTDAPPCKFSAWTYARERCQEMLPAPAPD